MERLTDDNLGSGNAVALQVLFQSKGCIHHVLVPNVPGDVICIGTISFLACWTLQAQDVCPQSTLVPLYKMFGDRLIISQG